MRYLTLKNMLIAVGVIVLVVSVYVVGQQSANVVIGEEKYNYDELVSQKEGLEDQIQDAKADRNALHEEITNLSGEISDKEDEIEEALEIYEKREEMEEDIEEMEGALESVEGEISEKESDLESLQSEITEVEEEPITLSAGHYVVGDDLQPGRYVAEPEGGSGNFSSHSDTGRLNFTTILGDGDRRESEYVFVADIGDQLELSTSVMFTEVE